MRSGRGTLAATIDQYVPPLGNGLALPPDCCGAVELIERETECETECETQSETESYTESIGTRDKVNG